MVGSPENVQTRLFVVFPRALDRLQPLAQFFDITCSIKALAQHVAVGQLINHPRVAKQVARWPFSRTQQTQQSLVHNRALEQQRQITFPPQKRLNPVHDAQCGVFTHGPFCQPHRRTLHQLRQASARLITQPEYFRVLSPLDKSCFELVRPLAGQMLQHIIEQWRRGVIETVRPHPFVAALAFGLSAQQLVKFARHKFAVGVKRM